MPMTIPVPDEFRTLCCKIAAEPKSIVDWASSESDDTFQIENFAGGFDGTENAFCFSYYNPKGEEFWFQLTLDEVGKISRSELSELTLLVAE